MDIEPTQALPLSDFEDDDADQSATNGKESVGRLKILSQKNYTETVHEIFPGKNVIGRQVEKCSIAVPDSKTLSKEHACIEVQGDTHLIYDLGSRNKTKRGKMYLTPEVRYELKDGDRIIFADMICVYHIGSDTNVEDSGSETGSESMLMADTQAVPGKDVANISDLLQPTQQYVGQGKDSGSRFSMDAPTQNFVDSYQDDSMNSPMVPFSHKKSSVMETPLPNQRGKASGAGLDISVVPESGDEGTPMSNRNSSIGQTLLYADDDEDETDDEAQEEEAMRKMAVAAMATQPYVDRASDSETDNGVGDSEGFDGPTQMFPALSTRGEDMVATQAYGDSGNESKVEDGDATQAFEDSTQIVGDVSLSQAPTQTFAAEEVPNLTGGTMAIQDSEEDGDTAKSVKPAKKVLWDDATQFIGDLDAATQAIGEDATQVFDETAPVQAMEDDSATQVIDPDEPTQKVAADAPTQVIDADTATQDIDPDAPTQAITDGDSPTQVLDLDATVPVDTPPMKARGRGRGRGGRGRGAAQVDYSEDIPEPGAKKKACFSDEPTQIISAGSPSSAATQAVDDLIDSPRTPKSVFKKTNVEDATQVMDDDELTASPVIPAFTSTSKKPDADIANAPTQALADTDTLQLSGDATQPMGDDATQPVGDDATQPMGDDVTQPVGDDATQTMDEEDGGDVTQTMADDTTDDATQPMGEDETQAMDTDVEVPSGGNENETVDPSNADIEPTQAYGMDIDEESPETTEGNADLEPTQAYEDEASPSITDSPPLLSKGTTNVESGTAKEEANVKAAKRGRKPTQKSEETAKKLLKGAETGVGASAEQMTETKAPVGRGARARRKSPLPAPDDSKAKTSGRGRKKVNFEEPETEEPDSAEVEPPAEKTSARRKGRPKASAAAAAAAAAAENEVQSKDEPIDKLAEEGKSEAKKPPARQRGRKSKAKLADPDETEAGTSTGVTKKGNDSAEDEEISGASVPEVSEKPAASGRGARSRRKSPLLPVEDGTSQASSGQRKKAVTVPEAQDEGSSTKESTEEKSGPKRRGRGRASTAKENSDNGSQEDNTEVDKAEASAEPEVKKPAGRRGRKSKTKEENSEPEPKPAAEQEATGPGDDEPTQAYEDEPVSSDVKQEDESASAVKDQPQTPRSTRKEQSQNAATVKEEVETKSKGRGRRGRASAVSEVSVKEEDAEEGSSKKQPRASARKTTNKNEGSTGRGRGRGARNSAGAIDTDSPAPAGRATRGKVTEKKHDDGDDDISVADSQESTRSRSSRRSARKDSDLESSQEVESTSGRGRRGAKKEQANVGTKSKRSSQVSGDIKEEIADSEAAVKTPPRRGRGALKNEPVEDAPASQSSQSSQSSRKQTGRRGGASVKVEEEAQEQLTPGRRKRQAPEAAEGGKPSKQKKKGAGDEPEPEEETEESPSTPSLRKRTIIRVPKVMFTGVIDEERMKIVKDLGGVSVDSIYECTHLITDQVRRTVKFLCGVARGIYVVDVTWLNRCRDADTFIDAKPFVVKDAANESKFGFNLSKSLDAAHNKPMLEGYSIIATKSVKPPPDNIKDIVKCAGGEYLSSMPKKKTDNTIIISCENDEKLCAGAMKLGIPVVSAEFILTGILRQTVDIEAYQLFNTNSAKRTTATSEEATTSKRKRR